MWAKTTLARDNWERLVEAVIKREELRQLCRQDSISTVNSDLSERNLNDDESARFSLVIDREDFRQLCRQDSFATVISDLSETNLRLRVKIVVKVAMNKKKSHRKALKVIIGISGVESAAVDGAAKDQLVVVGENIDAVELTRQLRKFVGYTELKSVSMDKKEELPFAMAVPICCPPPSVDEVRQERNCTIM